LEELLVEFVALSIEYDAQKKDNEITKAELDTLEFVYYRDLDHQDDLGFDLEQCKMKIMALKFN